MNQAIANVNENGVHGHQCIVELVFRGTSALGIALYRQGRFLHIKEFLPDGQAARTAIHAMLEPQVFRHAKILAVNGINWDNRGAAAVVEGLKSPIRPKSILFAFPWRNKDSDLYISIKNCVGVNRIHGNFVELVFQEGKVAGIAASPPPPPDRTHNPPLLQVQHFLPHCEAAALAKQMLLQPTDFDGASIVAVNGKPCPTRNIAIQAIRTSPRPMSIQFQLRPKGVATNDSSTPRDKTLNDADLGEKEESELAVKARDLMRRFRSLDLGDSIQNGLRQMSSSLTSSSTTTSTSSSDTTDIWDLDAQVKRKGAYDACYKFIRDHLETFIDKTPNATYEEWIQEIHPENTKMPESSVDDNLTLAVDDRFYVERSVHRKIWNEYLDGNRKFVPIRHFE